MNQKNYKTVFSYLFLVILACILCIPMYILATGSLMANDELKQCLAPLLTGMRGEVTWHVFPLYPTLRHYVEVLFDSLPFFTVFGNTVFMTVLTVAGQLLVGVPAAWGLAIYKCRFSNILCSIYMILMLLPFQVTMLSNYIVLDQMKLLDTYWSVILPGIFSTFPVFLIYRAFSGLHISLLESARIDGAGEFRIFLTIGIPVASTGILSAMVLEFLEYYSLIEQPMAFLKTPARWPLSLYLPQIDLQNTGFAFAASFLAMVPAVFIFFAGQEYLEQGIAASAIKE